MSVRAENLNLERCEATGKLRFSSRAKAHVHCNRTARSNKQHGDRYPIHVYACQSCGGHHVGHDSTYRSRNGKYGHWMPETCPECGGGGEFHVEKRDEFDKDAAGCLVAAIGLVLLLVIAAIWPAIELFAAVLG